MRGPVARLPNDGGCVSERCRHEGRGAAGADGLGTGGGVPMPPPQKIFFLIFYIKMACSGALWSMD